MSRLGRAHTVGVIADTHGLLRPEAAVALAGSELIVHAGDVGSAEVLDKLREIAPVVAVRGNNDKGAWAVALPAAAVVEIGGVVLYVLHDLSELDLETPRQRSFTSSSPATRTVRKSIIETVSCS